MNIDLKKTCFKNWLKYGQYAYNPNEYIVLHDKQLLIQIISKVACTSIKATIGKNMGIDYKLASGLDIHRHPGWHNLYGEQIKPYSHYDLICFVRHPLARLVSCYVERVLYKEKNDDFPIYYFDDYPVSIPANCPFSEFVYQVSRTPDYASDRHFKSQYASIFKNKSRLPDFIGKLEHLSKDWEKVAKRYDLPHKLLRLNKRLQPVGLPQNWQEFYSEADKNIVSQKFKNDLNYFKYEV